MPRYSQGPPSTRASRAEVYVDVISNYGAEGGAGYLKNLKLHPHRGARYSIVGTIFSRFRLYTDVVARVIVRLNGLNRLDSLDPLDRCYFCSWADISYRSTKPRSKTGFGNCHLCAANRAVIVRQKCKPASHRNATKRRKTRPGCRDYYGG